MYMKNMVHHTPALADLGSLSRTIRTWTDMVSGAQTMHKSHLYPEKRGQYDVGKYDQVNFIEETSSHQDDENEVHDGEDAKGDALHDGVRLR